MFHDEAYQISKGVTVSAVEQPRISSLKLVKQHRENHELAFRICGTAIGLRSAFRRNDDRTQQSRIRPSRRLSLSDFSFIIAPWQNITSSSSSQRVVVSSCEGTLQDIDKQLTEFSSGGEDLVLGKGLAGIRIADLNRSALP